MAAGPEDQDHLYDAIGVGYATTRRTDPRIQRRLHAPLAGASRVLNVGAGTGSYEPTDRLVVALEPSTTMIRQRPPGVGPAVQGVAERLPFADGAFDGGLALLTIHHWPDPLASLKELRRVTTGTIVALTFDHAVHAQQWLVTEYLPEMAGFDTGVPSPDRIAEALGGGRVEVLPIPHDCTDGFCHSWWRRPEAYLDPQVRAGISGIARLPTDMVDTAMTQLSEDLASGRWQQSHRELLEADEIDAGYRIVVASPDPPSPIVK